MSTTIKSEVETIAKKLTSKSTYADVMYALNVRMKVAQGRTAVRRGQIISHEEVKRRFAK